MRFAEDLTVEAAVCWLPCDREHVDTLVAQGRLEPDAPAKAGVSEVPVATDHSAPEMAVLAGRQALSRAGRDPSDVDVLLHSWLYHQGHDFWSPPHFVADQLGATHAVPCGIQQMCHGGGAALYTAALHLTADPAARAALVTTADRFQGPGFDRWISDSHVAYGDGATAAVLSRSGRGLRLVSQTQYAASELEAMYRGDDPFGAVPLQHRQPLDVRSTKRAFAAAGGMKRFADIAPQAVRHVLVSALGDAGLTPDDPRITCALLPRIGPSTLELTYLPVLRSLLPGAAVVRPGAQTGHLGSGDVIANLSHLREQHLLAPGESAVLLSGGGGFTWSCVVVQHHDAGE